MRFIQPRGSRPHKVLEVRQGTSCPSGQYWTCTTTPTHFAGCCVGNPCHNEGICPDNTSSSSTTKNTPTTSATTSPTTTVPAATVTLIQTANGSLTTVTPSATASSSSSNTTSNNALPIGIAVGVVALVALIIGAFFFFRKRKQRRGDPLPLPVEEPLSPTRNSGFFQSLKKRLPVGSPQMSPPPVYQEQETKPWQGHVELPAATVTGVVEMPVGEGGRLPGGEQGMIGGAAGGGIEGGLRISELPAQVPSRNLAGEERSQSVLSSMRYKSVDNGHRNR
ncbi:hypothetical protein K440DRAFT_644739 [Wilcoxina mikolae CBS 423.85]|nr:hypothetical protein K440DRAFT_644739 [Wilcoxina mikolae CBS 423.85]